MILGAYYLLWMIQQIVFGPLREPSAHLDHGHDTHEPAPAGHRAIRPVGWHEIAGLTPIMVMIVLIGVYPKPFLDRIKPPLVPIAENIHRPRPAIVAAPPVVIPPEVARRLAAEAAEAEARRVPIGGPSRIGR
jgi:NADH-quinone oxidoreductase subunit M